ncbi:MAG: ISAzo13 family transposase, partial [Deltaproteobacteria bacterium]|nr:ISAzo13 family transposase [Deltaproteobacteria bacterium]
TYEKGVKVPDEALAAVKLQPDSFHGEWNYTIAPSLPPSESVVL